MLQSIYRSIDKNNFNSRLSPTKVISLSVLGHQDVIGIRQCTGVKSNEFSKI